VKAFTFLAPEALDEAVALLDRHGRDARPIAGGQSLLLAMKDRIARPSVLVSLAGLADLRGWRYSPSGELEIGAATTYAALISAQFGGWHGEISAVAADLADRPVRTMGTIGGALCQADPRFDMPALAVGLGASVDTASAGGARTIPAAELFAASGGTVLGPGEILTTVRFPTLGAFSGVAFEKFRQRVFDAAVVSAVCGLRLDADARVADARIVLGAVAQAPVIAQRTGRQMTGRTLTEHDIAELGAAAMEEVLPVSQAMSSFHRYQRELVGVLVRRAITRALDQARS
jgi:carbon-monoxide dehydrogenase medium subunit